MPRLDTRLETEGAEFLVLAQLLIERIPAYKTYTNMPGYDLVATNPERNLAAKIQVKSRWRTGAPGFPIKHFGCDFVVFCRLNRGNKAGTGKIRPPEYFVFPIEVIESAPRSVGWGKIAIRHIANLESYRDGWNLIRASLGLPLPAAHAPIESRTVVDDSAQTRERRDGAELRKERLVRAVESKNEQRIHPPTELTLDRLRAELSALDGEEFVTLHRPRKFLFRILPGGEGVVYVPASTGKERQQSWKRISLLLGRFNELGSMRPGRYHDISKNASYFLTVIDHILRTQRK